MIHLKAVRGGCRGTGWCPIFLTDRFIPAPMMCEKRPALVKEGGAEASSSKVDGTSSVDQSPSTKRSR